MPRLGEARLMNRLRLTEDGFGLSGIACVLAVIIVVGITGFAIFQHNHKNLNNDQTTSTQPKSTSLTTSSPDNNQIAKENPVLLDIKEWGVNLTLSNITSSMYYYVLPGQPDVIYLSLKTVSDIAPECAANKVSLGGMSRLTPSEHQSALDDPTQGDAGTIQIGNYWYSYSSPQAACIDNAQEADAIQKALPDYDNSVILKAFETLKSD